MLLYYFIHCCTKTVTVNIIQVCLKSSAVVLYLFKEAQQKDINDMNNEIIAPKKCRGRPASFDRNELISQVMELFWERGYNNLSLNEIAKATGLTRASLYNAFKTKASLFLEAINQYSTNSPGKILTQIRKGDPVGPVFFRLFSDASKNLAADSKHRGCLAVNCMSELIPGNSELGDTLAKMQVEQRTLIELLIRQAIDQKELPGDTESETTADIIQAFLSGFSIFSKSGVSEQKLQAMAHSFLKHLGFNDPAEG